MNRPLQLAIKKAACGDHLLVGRHCMKRGITWRRCVSDYRFAKSASVTMVRAPHRIAAISAWPKPSAGPSSPSCGGEAEHDMFGDRRADNGDLIAIDNMMQRLRTRCVQASGPDRFHLP